MILRTLLAVFLAAPLLAASAPASGSDPKPPGRLETQVREWIAELSAQKAFAEWKDARPDIQALGPGTHGWLVVVKKSGEPVGYLVVHAAEDGTYRLGEYGTGPDILFSPALLDRSLRENGLIPPERRDYEAKAHYFHPFAAVWEVTAGKETFWVDAKTGELLPFDAGSWSLLLPSLLAYANENGIPDRPASKTETVFLRETFDAYESLPWLTGTAPLLLSDGKEAQDRLRSGMRLRYVTEPYGDAALYALPVTGYLQWSGGRLDLALDMAGSRFVSFEQLRQYGKFYE